ncbi:MAG: hypothetical protein AAB486_00090 [Patescibacteria group bacterium]
MIYKTLFVRMAALLALNSAVITNSVFYTPTTGYTGFFLEGKKPVNTISASVSSKRIDRETKLNKLLIRYHSPLAEQSKTFIAVADKYGLDWRLLPAITGMESTFGQFLIEDSFNPFGWGGGYIYFDSFEDGIDTVGRELAKRFKTHTTPEEIGPTYTPPNFKNWINGVNFFMRQLDES